MTLKFEVFWDIYLRQLENSFACLGRAAVSILEDMCNDKGDRCYSNRRDYKRLRNIYSNLSKPTQVVSVYQASTPVSDFVSKQKPTNWNQDTARNVFTALKQHSSVVKYFLTKKIWLSDSTVGLYWVWSNTKAAIFPVIVFMFFVFPRTGRLFFKMQCNCSLS